MIFAHWPAIEHRIERGYFVHSHARHVQDLGNFVHGGDRQPAVLSLRQIQQRYHGTAFVSFGINCEQRFDPLLIRLVELERGVGIIMLAVSVLKIFKYT